jgi:hypothetical protein
LIKKQADLGTTEQELQVLRGQLVHGDFVVVDSAADHVGLLLLKQNHTRFDRVFDTETRDDARASLTNAVAAVSGLPFRRRVPPTRIERLVLNRAGE